MKLVNMLRKFYQNEANRIPHATDDIVELAWELAEFMDELGYNDDADNLRANPSPKMIDYCVDIIHTRLVSDLLRQVGKEMVADGQIEEHEIDDLADLLGDGFSPAIADFLLRGRQFIEEELARRRSDDDMWEFMDNVS